MMPKLPNAEEIGGIVAKTAIASRTTHICLSVDHASRSRVG